MRSAKNEVLTEEFLNESIRACFHDKYYLGVWVSRMQDEYLPDRDYMVIHRELVKHYSENQSLPSKGSFRQAIAHNKGASELIGETLGNEEGYNSKSLLLELERYIKQTRFKKAYKEAGELFNRSMPADAEKKMTEYAGWASGFSLVESDFTDVTATFTDRFKQNRERHNSVSKSRNEVNRFYIDELDEKNGERSLRRQLTCFLAATGVGKSHIARWVGMNASKISGLNVLHFQLEGSKEEVVNAYSASLAKVDTYRYETGTIRDVEFAKMEALVKAVSGKIFVKSYPKFNAKVSTIDIRNGIHEFKERHGMTPDVVIIDSMDLLNDSSGRKYGESGERHRRVAVANDLKDLASDEDVWMVATYQSTIENSEWLNDEKNVLTEYNAAEAKGLSRPLTHLITLNRSDRENREQTMRLHVAKSRFFQKGDTIRIATNYDQEQFYDRERTININKAG
jgi:KaiC/GvpD/RAD55 family RecA-like ATPase